MHGEMAEWLKAAVLKTVKGESSSRVRIPLSPLRQKTPERVFFVCGERRKRGTFSVEIRRSFEVDSTERRIYLKGILVVTTEILSQVIKTLTS